jgi:hypothetical protein
MIGKSVSSDPSTNQKNFIGQNPEFAAGAVVTADISNFVSEAQSLKSWG